ncbi:MAG: hypothetical protein MJ249_15420 [Kiritimatiellae bacterium]|nr:hypothetical protein [Kiritimatiellia bacterium]
MAPLNQKLTLNTSEFYLNGNGKIADVTFRTGSTLTGSSYFKLGNSAAATSTLVLDGGTIDLMTQSTLGWVWMGVNANQVDFTVNAGTLTTWGILCRTGWKDPATFGEQFTMNGGTLNITGDAIRGWTHFNHFCEFNGGMVNSLANWHVEQMRSSGFGSRPGGLVTLQLNDKTVNWATGLAGAADVQLKGNGTLKSGTGEKSTKLFMQGALTGKWTVENSGENDLSGASAFLGGLELAENVNAKLHIAGSNLVEAVYLQTSATTVTKTDALKSGSAPSTAMRASRSAPSTSATVHGAARDERQQSEFLLEVIAKPL